MKPKTKQKTKPKALTRAHAQVSWAPKGTASASAKLLDRVEKLRGLAAGVSAETRADLEKLAATIERAERKPKVLPHEDPALDLTEEQRSELRVLHARAQAGSLKAEAKYHRKLQAWMR